jgi:hypothetical protein
MPRHLQKIRLSRLSPNELMGAPDLLCETRSRTLDVHSPAVGPHSTRLWGVPKSKSLQVLSPNAGRARVLRAREMGTRDLRVESGVTDRPLHALGR